MPPVSPAPAPPAPPPVAPPVVAPLPPALRALWRGVFRFFSSVKLAILLLAVLIVASVAGTLYETSFDAKIAKAYIYDASWFNAWLLILGLNLLFAALSRWPWKRHHTGFLITHLGIITLLIGSYIGKSWGIEGTMTIFKGRPPNNQLVIDQKVLHLQQDGARSLAWPVEIIGRKPTAERPWKLGQTVSGYQIEVVDYAPFLATALEPKEVDANTAAAKPAAHVKLVSARLNQTIDRWLLADDNTDNNALNLGMAAVRLWPAAVKVEAPAPAADGTPPPPAPLVASRVDEVIIAFAQKPNEQISQPAKDTIASGAKLKLVADMNGRRLEIIWRGATYEFDPVRDKGRDEELGSGSGILLRIDEYWPDFELKDGQPSSASEEPRNPAVLVRIRGQLAAPAAGEAPLAGEPETGGNNQAFVFVAPDGALTYELRATSTGVPLKGTLELNKPINTGWADWQLQVTEVLPRAVEFTRFFPHTGKKPTKLEATKFTEGVKVRLHKEGESYEEWVPGGWRVSLPTKPKPVLFTYGFRLEPLPIGLELVNFEVERNEGNDTPAGFRSTVRVTDREGGTGTGFAHMNNPFNYPSGPLFTFTGFTYKISQASWNPENLNQSSVQILRDPGWSLKWIGSLLICLGIFALFYLRPVPKAVAAAAGAAKARSSIAPLAHATGAPETGGGKG